MFTDIPKRIHITEEGPREGFQSEPPGIPTRRKVELIDALSRTGLSHVQTVSFVNARLVPSMVDADEVVAQMDRRPGVRYTALWFNEKGLDRAIATGRLDIRGYITFIASAEFLKRNQGWSPADQMQAQRRLLDAYSARAIPVDQLFIPAAFGCNFEGDVPLERVVRQIDEAVSLVAEYGFTFKVITVADTMAWATPITVKRLVGAVRGRHPEIELSLHLHNTRGLGLASAWAGLEMGVTRFDSSIGGLGGCPFAGHKGAAGNIATEDFVHLCDEAGIETGVDLHQLIECARLAEDIVGHPLPGSVMRGGTLFSRRANSKNTLGVGA